MNTLERILGHRWQVYVGHAARADRPLDLTLEGRLSPFTTVKTNSGEMLDPSDHYILIAVGPSMESRGIMNGSKLVAKQVTEELLPKIAKGAFVVVNAKADASNTGRRLRVFKQYKDGVVEFEDDYKGVGHTARSIADIEGVVTHVAVN